MLLKIEMDLVKMQTTSIFSNVSKFNIYTYTVTYPLKKSANISHFESECVRGNIMT